MGLRVLVVDDDADTVQTMALLVELWGHQVHIAQDGETALLKAQSERPQVVLFDIRMPGMTGLELARVLKEAPGLIKPLLIAISVYTDPQSQLDSLQAGAHMHLAKPVPPD